MDGHLERRARVLRAQGVIEALWCAHCDRLALARECRACRCSGTETKLISGTHIVCIECAERVPVAELGDLLWCEDSID